MDFRDEYKNEINSAMPDEQAMERIRRGVAEKLAAPRRKPFPVRRTAAICGSAACLMIGLAAATLALSKNSVQNQIGMAGGAYPSEDPTNSKNYDFNGIAAEGGDTGSVNNASTPSSSINIGEADNTQDAEIKDGFTDFMRPDTENADGTAYGDAAVNGGTPANSEDAVNGGAAVLEFTDDGVALTIMGTVTHYAEIPAFNGSGTAPEPGPFFDGSDGLTEVTTDSGEQLFIRTDGDILYLYDADLSLLGMFSKVE